MAVAAICWAWHNSKCFMAMISLNPPIIQRDENEGHRWRNSPREEKWFAQELINGGSIWTQSQSLTTKGCCFPTVLLEHVEAKRAQPAPNPYFADQIKPRDRWLAHCHRASQFQADSRILYPKPYHTTPENKTYPKQKQWINKNSKALEIHSISLEVEQWEGFTDNDLPEVLGLEQIPSILLGNKGLCVPPFWGYNSSYWVRWHVCPPPIILPGLCSPILTEVQCHFVWEGLWGFPSSPIIDSPGSTSFFNTIALTQFALWTHIRDTFNQHQL
jgi:hypothetical protein